MATNARHKTLYDGDRYTTNIQCNTVADPGVQVVYIPTFYWKIW